MSFDTDPTQYDFASGPNSCAFCFATGETPKDLFLGLSGVQRGDLWTASDPPPPNGTWKLSVISPCTWQLINASATFNYIVTGSTTQLIITKSSLTFFNTFGLGTACLRQVDNSIVDPVTTKYYGGYAQLLVPLDSADGNNIELMGLLNIEPAAETYCQPFGVASPELVIRYSRRFDKTNVHIKYDLT